MRSIPSIGSFSLLSFFPRGYSFTFLTIVDYKKDVLGVHVGATNWMCYENDVLGRQVGATKKIGYEKDVLGKNGDLRS